MVRTGAGLSCAAVVMIASPCFGAVPQTPPAVAMVSAAVVDGATVAVHGEVSSLVAGSQDLGAMTASTVLPQLTLILKRSPARQAALDALVADQLKPGNAAYRRWVRPEELFGAFGPAMADIDRVTGWLRAHGFTVHGVSADGMTVGFAGTVGQVEDAFGTQMHRLSRGGEVHFANVSEPRIPTALALVVQGITLHNFFPKPALRSAGLARQSGTTGAWTLGGTGPAFLTPKTKYGTFQAIGPADFTTIYDVNPLRAGNALTGAPLTGAGTTIILLNDGDAQPKDWTRYRSVFGLGGYKGTLSIEHPGQCGDPGINEDSVEASLDIEVGSISAPDANVVLATCPSANFNTNSGLFTALENIVSLGTPAQVISVSYGFCEAGYGPTALMAWSRAAEEAAAEGLSVFVATGDAASADCDNDNTEAEASLGLAVNGLASNPYVTAVGGTDFSDEVTGQTSTYFASSNRADDETALSYVPEIVWNDSCASPVLLALDQEEGLTTATSPVAFCNSAQGGNFLDIVGGGGGRSAVYSKPEWQNAGVYGVPADGARDLPDLSMFASSGFYGHFTLFCDSDAAQGGLPCRYENGTDLIAQAVGGTSVATPSIAGIMLLENQYMAEQQGASAPVRIGNVAPRLYQLAAAQLASATELKSCNASLGNKTGSVCVFHNVTQNNNSVPCVAGTPNCYADATATMGIGVLSSNLKTGAEAYRARTGYSLATGLGSVDAFHLVIAY